MKIKVGGFYFLKNGDIIEVFSADLPTERPILAVLYMEANWQALRYNVEGRISDIHNCVLDIATTQKGEFLEVDRQTLQKLRALGRIPTRQKRRRTVDMSGVQRTGNGRGYAYRSKNS